MNTTLALATAPFRVSLGWVVFAGVLAGVLLCGNSGQAWADDTDLSVETPVVPEEVTPSETGSWFETDAVPPTDAVPLTDTVPEEVVEFHVASPREAEPGGTFRVSGVCTLFGIPATSVRTVFYYDSQPDLTGEYGFGVQVPINADGSFDADLTIPADARPGVYLLAWGCSLGDAMFGAAVYGENEIFFTVLGDIPPATTTPPTITTPPVTTTPATTTPAADTGEELAETGTTHIPTLWAGALALTAAGTITLTLRRVMKNRFAHNS